MMHAVIKMRSCALLDSLPDASGESYIETILSIQNTIYFVTDELIIRIRLLSGDSDTTDMYQIRSAAHYKIALESLSTPSIPDEFAGT